MPMRWSPGSFWPALALWLMCLGASSALAQRAPAVTHLVDPYIGSLGAGRVFSGASMPFGMVSPGPDLDTSVQPPRSPRILGFSTTHINGEVDAALGDVLLQPAFGVRSRDWSSRYLVQTLLARPGYHAVTLQDHRVYVELTATPRVALHRYTFPRSQRVQVLIDLQHALGVDADQRLGVREWQLGPQEVSGVIESRGLVTRLTAFVIQFDRPVAASSLLPGREGDTAGRWVLDFDLPAAGRPQLQARVALSTVDVAGARRNLAEAEGRSFDLVRKAAEADWNALLSRVRLPGAPERQQVGFYSALYRSLLHPSVLSDVDGRYRGSTGQVEAAESGTHYSSFTLRPASRAALPLLGLLVPERLGDIVQSLLADQRRLGHLPASTRWGQQGAPSLGNPALPVIAQALAQGVPGIDAGQALGAMLATATQDREGAPPWGALAVHGHFPFDIVPEASVTQTLEAGLGDDALARVAGAQGRADLARAFAERALGYRRLYDPGTRLLRGRDSAGAWRDPFVASLPGTPLRGGDHVDAHPLQESFAPAQHDLPGLMALWGGPPDFTSMLDRLFAADDEALPRQGVGAAKGLPGIVGRYDHGAATGQHIPWLYAFSMAPWRGHALVQRLSRRAYTIRWDGLPAADVGALQSAWLVFATLGWYPVAPASGSYVLGAPQVQRAEIHWPGGRVLRVLAPGASGARPYASAVRFDGRELDWPEIDHGRLVGGGELRFTMSPLPTRP
jgi:predicted alpha-1,2-mannosidase